MHLAEAVSKFGLPDGPATQKIVQLVEAGLKAANELEQRERAKIRIGKANPYFTDFGKCARKVVFSLQGVEESEPLTTDSLINFGVGHAVEDWLAGVLEAQGATLIRERRIEVPVGKTVVSGRIDFLALFPEDRLMVELKTLASRSMQAMLKGKCRCGDSWSATREGELYKNCKKCKADLSSRVQEHGKDDHRRQLNGYLHASQLGLIEGFGKFDSGLLVYVVKDATRREPAIHAFEVAYDKRLAESDLVEAAANKMRADAGLVPPIPAEFKQFAFPCSYCGYKSVCWSDEKEAVNG